jgi:hypothetical protein
MNLCEIPTTDPTDPTDPTDREAILISGLRRLMDNEVPKRWASQLAERTLRDAGVPVAEPEQGAEHDS